MAAASASVSSSSGSTPTTTDNMITAQKLSRYCAYLVAGAPDLLPDNIAWTKRRYQEVKKAIVENASKPAPEPELETMGGGGEYGRLITSFSDQGSHELLNKGAMLGTWLVGEAQRPPEQGESGGGEGVVWKLLAEFWSEMVLYLAPSDKVKHHVEALQRGGELITLLLHAGITSRPPEINATACVLVANGRDPDFQSNA